ncbi:TonB-dependent receptor [Flavobacteriales bacterium]|nr:TonB-dependent receptor [Flavobacteriales bacterium]
MREIILITLTIALAICNLKAQNSIEKNLDEVIVSANRAQTEGNITNVQIISLEEIENAPVQTIEDLLEYAMNVDVRQRGGQGVQADISIRGGTFEQVLVMLNGIKLNDPQTGHHTMDLPVSLEQIERIEIITGGASRIFGNYAYTGAINIITKLEMANSFSISRGGNAFKSGGINYHTSTGNLKHNISVNQKESDGYTEGVDYKIKNYYYQAKTNIDGINALFNAGYTNKEFGAFSFYTPKYPNQFETTQTTFASLQLRKEGKITLDNKISWRKHNDEFILFRENPSWYHNFHETNVFSMDMNVIQKTKTGTNVIGMEIRTDNIISNVLGNDLESPIEIDTNNFYYKGANTTTTNLFIEKNINLKNLAISAGIMMNINSEYGNEYFPGIDMAYNFSNNITLFTSYNKSMRTPNYTELYYISPTNQGNINLKSEHSTNQELGLKWNGKSHKTTFTYYKREGENMIDWVLINGDSIWRTQNLSQLTTTGYELNSRIDINKMFNTNLPISTLNINYAVNESDTTSEGFQSAYVLDHLKSNLSFTASQNISEKIRIDWRASRQDREGGYIDFESGEDVDYLPFWLISTRLSCKVFNNSTIFLEINNLFDNEYVDFGNIPQPGRWMRAGVKITI